MFDLPELFSPSNKVRSDAKITSVETHERKFLMMSCRSFTSQIICYYRIGGQDTNGCLSPDPRDDM